MVVSRVPRVIQEVISKATVRLTRPQRGQLAMVLTALLIGVGAKLKQMPGAVKSSRHRTSVGRFLNQSEWNETGLLDGAVQRCLKLLRLTKRDVMPLVIDDTRIVKRGRKRDDISKLWDHTHQPFAHGHTVVTAALHAPARKQKRIPLPRCQERLADFRHSVRHDQIQVLTNRIRHAPTRNQLRQTLTAM